MIGAGFWLIVGATGIVFVLWLAANIFLVAEGASAVVPLTSRPNWHARLNAAMLILPVLGGVGAALLGH